MWRHKSKWNNKEQVPERTKKNYLQFWLLMFGVHSNHMKSGFTTSSLSFSLFAHTGVNVGMKEMHQAFLITINWFSIRKACEDNREREKNCQSMSGHYKRFYFNWNKFLKRDTKKRAEMCLQCCLIYHHQETLFYSLIDLHLHVGLSWHQLTFRGEIDR